MIALMTKDTATTKLRGDHREDDVPRRAVHEHVKDGASS